MYIVTGANGFIGSAMVWELNRHGIEDIIAVDPVVLAKRPGLLSSLKISEFMTEVQLWDFLQRPEVQNKVSWIIHMGACSSTTEMNVEFLRNNNTLYTQRLYEWCQKFKKGFIYASSAATYGGGELGFSETADLKKLKPLNPYGDSKLNFDKWLDHQWTELHEEAASPTYGLRFFNVFGPNENFKESMASVAFKAFHEIKNKGHLSLFKSYNSKYKDGEQLRDFVYIKDITRWMFELIQKQPEYGIYNMGFGKAHSWLDLAQGVFEGLEKKLQINWIEMPENIRGQYQYFTQADMSKWRSQKLSEPQWSLNLALKDYVQNYLILNQTLRS